MNPIAGLGSLEDGKLKGGGLGGQGQLPPWLLAPSLSTGGQPGLLKSNMVWVSINQFLEDHTAKQEP